MLEYTVNGVTFVLGPYGVPPMRRPIVDRLGEVSKAQKLWHEKVLTRKALTARRLGEDS